MILLLFLFILDAISKSSSFSFKAESSLRSNPILSREDVLSKVAATAPILICPSASFALEEKPNSRNVLLDLPPQKPNTVRLYLCRHGQTENNRLHIVQGAHVDPPLNDTGRRMAARLGQEFAALDRRLSKGVRSNNNIHGLSKVIFHSKLQRSKETASIVGGMLNGSDDSFPTNPRYEHAAAQLMLLDSLGEVDFGLHCEGRKETTMRIDSYRRYANWAFGNIDATNICNGKDSASSIDQGETGRLVLQRAATALTSLLQQAQDQNSGSIIAISHSAFLRTLLSLSMDTPLLEASILQQANGCINVLDLDPSKKPKIFEKRSNLFIGGSGPADFFLEIPHVKVVRINEKRHLSGLM
jgi:broad specificity phosphatase PhoE